MQNFCFNLNDKYQASDLVGQKAVVFSQLKQNNVNIPTGFVLTGYAFDEFLVDNGLVEYVLAQIDLMVNDPKKYSIYAKQIREKLQQYPVPENIRKLIEEQYQRLSQQGEPFVDISQSAIANELDEANYLDESVVYENIKGVDVITESVKSFWVNLFSDEAVKYRLDIGYEGNLSQAIMILKSENAEISGKLYNFDLDSKTTNQFSITANLGINPKYTPGGESDYYLINKVDGRLLQKINNSQKFMNVRSRNTSGEPLEQVKVSTAWSEKAKLDDLQLQKMQGLLGLLEKIWQGKFIANWVYSSGQIIVTNINFLSTEEENRLQTFSWKTNADVQIVPPQPKSDENLEELDKDDVIKFIKDNSDHYTLENEERSLKAENVKEMIREIKTVTEVWWEYDIQPNELKVYKNNIDGFGVFSFKQISKDLGFEEDIENIKEKKNLQKQICEHLAKYMVSIAPKPIFILLDRDLNFEAQVEILSQLRNLYGHKNFWVILPELRELSEISSYKKILSTNSFRRTGAFKIFQLVSQPIFLANLGALVEQGIDGILLDIDLLNDNALGDRLNQSAQGDNYELLMNFLVNNLIEKSSTKLFTYLRTKYPKMLERMLDEMLDNGINGIVYNKEDLFDFKESLTEKESHILTKSLKKMKTQIGKLDKKVKKKK